MVLKQSDYVISLVNGPTTPQLANEAIHQTTGSSPTLKKVIIIIFYFK